MTESIMSILKGDQGQGSQILAILFICGIIALIIWGVVTLVKSSPAPAPAPAPAPTTVEQETPPPIKSITLTPGKKNTQEPEVLGYEIEKIGECVFSPEMNKDLTMTITLKVPNQIYLNTFENISLIITNLDETPLLVLKDDEEIEKKRWHRNGFKLWSRQRYRIYYRRVCFKRQCRHYLWWN